MLVSNLEKWKAFPISSYLFDLYHRNECLREEELQEIEIAKECLEYGIGEEVETPPHVEVLDSEEESVCSKEQRKRQKISLGSRMKFTYKSPKGKSPVWNPDWKDMTSLDLDDDPFWRVWEELDQMQSWYSKLELVAKGASKLFNDCKIGNIVKELKKLTQ